MAIAISFVDNRMNFAIGNIPAFPGATFRCCFPEAVGDAAETTWLLHDVEITWEQRDEGAFCTGRRQGEVSYTVDVNPEADAVDVRLTVINESDRVWKESLAFNCLNPGATPAIIDHDCRRHWVGVGGEIKRLIEVPRVFGPRPAIQLYSVEGAPPGSQIPFVANFASTPDDLILEPWMAIQSADGGRLMGVASAPGLFLFQNMEYSCIHSAPGFGKLQPGETGEAVTRLYFAEQDVESWRDRVRADLGTEGA